MKNDVIAIITPIGNEIESIDTMYQELRKVNWHLWITVIDSFCQDGSDVALRKLAKCDPRIVVLCIGKGTGVAKAYIRGVQHAIKLNATKIIEVDIGHPTHLIPRIVEALDQFPLVMGTRFNGGKFVNVLWRRKLLSRLGTALAHFVLQLPFSDCTSGLQGFTRKVAVKMPFDQFQSTGHFYQTEFKFYCQLLSFIEIPFTYIGTKSSVQTSAVKESLRILQYLWRQPRHLLITEDCTPLSNDRTQLLVSIQEDLQRLVGNEQYITGHNKLQFIVHRLIMRLIRLIEGEMK